jgi:hypothetical protein
MISPPKMEASKPAFSAQASSDDVGERPSSKIVTQVQKPTVSLRFTVFRTHIFSVGIFLQGTPDAISPKTQISKLLHLIDESSRSVPRNIEVIRRPACDP